MALFRAFNYIKRTLTYYLQAQATIDLLNYSLRITNIIFQGFTF